MNKIFFTYPYIIYDCLFQQNGDLFQCTVGGCSKVYNRSDNLSSHLQIAHGVKLIKKDKGGSLALHVMSNSFMQHV